MQCSEKLQKGQELHFRLLTVKFKKKIEQVWLILMGCQEKAKLLFKMKMVRKVLNKSQDFWNNLLWTDKFNVEMFGNNT